MERAARQYENRKRWNLHLRHALYIINARRWRQRKKLVANGCGRHISYAHTHTLTRSHTHTHAGTHTRTLAQAAIWQMYRISSCVFAFLRLAKNFPILLLIFINQVIATHTHAHLWICEWGTCALCVCVCVWFLHKNWLEIYKLNFSQHFFSGGFVLWRAAKTKSKSNFLPLLLLLLLSVSALEKVDTCVPEGVSVCGYWLLNIANHMLNNAEVKTLNVPMEKPKLQDAFR